MIAEDLKSRIEALSRDERRELSILLTKLELEEDEGYWERIRRRLADDSPDRWVPVEQL